MKYFPDNTKVKLEHLRARGIYDSELLDELEKGHFDKLKELPEKYKENRDYMEPILYAMLDKFNTYEVYEHYADKLKDRLKTETRFSEEIINTNPELMKNSPIGENKELILKYKEIKPEIIQYISSKLESDQEFLGELCNSNNAEVIKEAVEKYSAEKLIDANPELKSDEHFMAVAISQDISAIKHADESILNSYDVFREASINNAEVISYVIDNNKDLGLEAVSGVRDTAKEKADKGYMDVINENAEKGTSKRFQWVKAAIENHGTNHPVALNVMIGMAAKSEEFDPGLIDQAMDYAFLSKVRLEKIIEEEKNYEIPFDEYRGLVNPLRVDKLIKKSQRELSPELQQRWEEYVEFYEEFREKYLEQKKEREQNEKKEESKSKEDKLREEISGHSSPEDYEKSAKEWEKRKAERDKQPTRETTLEK